MHKLQYLHTQDEFKTLHGQIQQIGNNQTNDFDSIFPVTVMNQLNTRFMKEESTTRAIVNLEIKVGRMESQIDNMTTQMQLHTLLLQQLLGTGAPSLTLDANKKGENVVPVIWSTREGEPYATATATISAQTPPSFQSMLAIDDLVSEGPQ